MTLRSPLSNATSPSKGIDTLQDWREEVFAKVIRSIGIAGTVVYSISMALTYKSTEKNILFLYTLVYLTVMVAAFLPRIPTLYRTYIFSAVIFLLGIIASWQKAAIGDGRIWLLLATFLAAVFLGRRAGLISAILASIVWSIIGFFFNASILQEPVVAQFSLPIWGGTTITFLVVGITTVLTINALSTHLSQNVNKKASLVKRTEEQNQELEKQRDSLERRSKTLEASAKVSRQLASLMVRDEILAQIAKIINKEFELSRTSLFLFDADNALCLESSSGTKNQAQNAHDCILSSKEGIVKMAISNKKAYTNLDTHIGLNIALEETRSYIAIPLYGQEKVMGALVLESEEVEGFGAERASIFQMLVDHIAVLLENANLIAQKESALEAERRAYGKIAQGAWLEFINKQEYGSYRRDAKGLSVVPAKPYSPQEKKIEAEQVPIRIRGKIIGHIDAHKPKNRTWTASEKEVLSILASRLETAMDSARLYQDSQQRAERERIISETSAQIRESLDIESVLETAARELRNALDLSEAEIWINAENIQRMDNTPSINLEKEDKKS